MPFRGEAENPEERLAAGGVEPREKSVEVQIEDESERLSDNVEGLGQEIAEFGGREELAAALNRRPKIKKSFFEKHAGALRTAIFLAAMFGLNEAKEEMKEHSPRQYDKVMEAVDPVMRPIDRFFTFLFGVRGEKPGEYNFSEENVAAQRAWLQDWLGQRRLGRGETAEDRQKMIELLSSIDVVYEKQGNFDAKGGAHQPYGDRRITLNKNYDQALEATNFPLHEFSHASDKGGVFIGDEARDVIKQVIKNPAEFMEEQKDFREKHPGFELTGYRYLTEPSEFKARLMAVRKILGLKPDQVVDDKLIDEVYDKLNRDDVQDLTVRQLMYVIKNKTSLQRALNELTLNERGSERNDRQA